MNTIDSASNFMNNITSTCTAVLSPNSPINSNCITVYSNGNAYRNLNTSHQKTDKTELAQSVDLKNEIEFRPLCSTDVQELKKLCADWFPVE